MIESNKTKVSKQECRNYKCQDLLRRCFTAHRVKPAINSTSIQQIIVYRGQSHSPPFMSGAYNFILYIKGTWRFKTPFIRNHSHRLLL